MRKTTVYLSDDLDRALKRTAAETGRTQADLMREGIANIVEARLTPRPRIPLFRSHHAMLAERVDELLDEGFGRD